jgi:serine/threonine protein kinase
MRPRQFGKYLLLEKIGSGGMAEIFKAVVRGAGDFQKVVVIKRILIGYSRDPSFVKMFVDEARITAPLQHANIVSIHEFDQVDGQYYLAMELIHGRDLQRVMARANKLGRTLPPELAVHMVGEVCKALWYAYNARDPYGNALQIIHRDTSPSNVLLSFDGEVKVTDFGVAKAATSGGDQGGAGVLKGKLGYMSPEQVMGREIDHRSDIFGLGIILFETLTLKRMFLGRTDLQTLINVRDADVEKRLASHPEIEAGLADILRKALAKDRERRYKNSHDFLNDLQDWLYSRNHRVSSTQVSALMRDLFPEEAEQELLPLEVEEVTEGSRSAAAAAAVAAIDELRAGREPTLSSGPGGAQPSTATGLQVEPANVQRDAGKGVPNPSTMRLKPPLPVQPPRATDPDLPDPSIDDSGLRAMAQNTRSARVAPQAASFRIRDREGNLFGPVSFDNVLSLLKSRSITEDESCSMNDGEWMPVGDVTAFRGHMRDAGVEASRRVLLFEGTVERRVMVRLITQIVRDQRLSGVLTLKQGSNQKEVYFRDGRPRFIYSNLKLELLGEFLVRRRMTTRESVDDAVRQSGNVTGRLGDALVSQGVVGAHELAEVLSLQFRERFLELFSWDSGWYGFFENASIPKAAVTMDLDPMEALSEAVRAQYPLTLLRALLSDAGPRRLVRAENTRVVMSELKLLPREMRVLNLLDSQPSINQLLKVLPQGPETELLVYRVVFLMTETGAWTFRGSQSSPPRR